MKCPQCGKETGYYTQPPQYLTEQQEELIKAGKLNPATLEEAEPYPLYQVSYPGGPEYISPRCARCFDRTMKTVGIMRAASDRHVHKRFRPRR